VSLGWGYSIEVEHLSRMSTALGSIPDTTQKKKEKKKKTCGFE
jgi:hypothetical protein